MIALTVILSALGIILWKNSFSFSESQEKTGKLLLSPHQIQNLTEVKFRNQETEITFQTTEKEWVVSSLNYTLNRPKLQELLLKMSQEKLLNLVSKKRITPSTIFC